MSCTIVSPSGSAASCDQGRRRLVYYLLSALSSFCLLKEREMLTTAARTVASPPVDDNQADRPAIRSMIYRRGPGQLISQLMLDHAVRFVAGRRGAAIPESAEPTRPSPSLTIRESRFGISTSRQHGSPVGEILSRKANWLGAHPDLLTGPAANY